MERSLPHDGFSQRLGAILHAPGNVIARTRQFMTELHVGNIKDLPRSKRVKILIGELESLKQVESVYDETFNLDLWMVINSKYGSDAVADVARAGFITKEFVISSTRVVKKNEIELNEGEIFEEQLNWLEENGRQHGWKQDETSRKTN